MSLFDSASLVVTPNGQKAGKLYSIKPTDGSGDLSVVRATSATRVDANGLVEIPRTNLLTYSEQFDNAAWVKTNTTVTANATTAPDGTTTADKLIPNTTSALHIAESSSFSSVSGLSYVFSFYAKKAEYDFIQVTGSSALLPIRANFNLSNGTLGTVDSGITATITSVGNGWYRCTALFAAAATGSYRVILCNITNSAAGRFPSFAGNGTDGVFVWGAMLQEGNVATEYIPTVASIRTKFAGITQDGSSASNIPRLDYTNGSCPSILVEPQRTNIFPKSQTTSTWTFTNISRTANNGISPDGTQNADLLFPTTSGAVSFNSDNTASSLVVGQPFVCSFFIKLNTSFTSNVGANIIDLRLSGAAVWTRPTIRVNFETGEVTNVTNASYISSTNYGNGWYRITFGAIPTGTGAAVGLQSPTGVTLNGGSFYIWGLQGESNSTYATSYIPTTSASVTRNADVISKTGISSLIGQTEGTLFSEFYYSGNAKGGIQIYPFYIGQGTFQDSVSIGIYQDALLCRVFYGATPQNYFTSSELSIGIHKVAFVYANNNLKLFLDGVLIASDSSATIPTCNQVYVGSSGTSITPQLINVNKNVLWKTALTDEQCINLTTI